MGKHRSDLNQEEKRLTFKQAFETIKNHEVSNNMLAAYVVAFSVIEDRVRAMYYVWHISSTGLPPSERLMQGSLAKIIKALTAEGIIPKSDAEKILSEAKTRNRLFHSAMWNLNEFSNEAVARVLEIARTTDRFRKRQSQNLAKPKN